MLSAIQNVQCQVLGRTVKNKLKSLWKQAGVAWLSQYSSLYLEGLRKTIKSFIIIEDDQAEIWNRRLLELIKCKALQLPQPVQWKIYVKQPVRL
jgi:hypothetical protein